MLLGLRMLDDLSYIVLAKSGAPLVEIDVGLNYVIDNGICMFCKVVHITLLSSTKTADHCKVCSSSVRQQQF